jgi:hypothetical protein
MAGTGLSSLASRHNPDHFIDPAAHRQLQPQPLGSPDRGDDVTSDAAGERFDRGFSGIDLTSDTSA